jgi:hypothetical protein
MSLVRIHCTPLNLEIPLTILTETEQAWLFTVLRSASLATVLLAVEAPLEEVLSIQDGDTTTYYHALHAVDSNLLRAALQTLIAEVFHDELTIAENCDAISDAAPGDVLSWLLWEAKRVEEQAAALPDGGSRREHMAYATSLRGSQACLACLGVEHTGLLFSLRDAELHARKSWKSSPAGGQAQ